MAGYSINEARDSRGRWVSSGASSDWVAKNQKEILIGTAIVGGALLTYGSVNTAAGFVVSEDAALVGAMRTAGTVRKVGPVGTKGLQKLGFRSAPDTVEAWQYNKYLVPQETIGKVRPIRDAQVGAELVKGNQSHIIGAAKPQHYDELAYKSHPAVKGTGKVLLVGAPVLVGAALYDRKH